MNSFAADAIAEAGPWRFDLGGGTVADGYRGVTEKTRYDPAAGFGWVGDLPRLETRDRGEPEEPWNDFVFGREAAVFRVDLAPGIYRLTLKLGDRGYSDHVLRPSVNVKGVGLPELRPAGPRFVTLTAGFELGDNHLEILCDSPVDNWVLNAIEITPTDTIEPVQVVRDRVKVEPRDTWDDVAGYPSPAAERLEEFRTRIRNMPEVVETGLGGQDYLALISGNVDFFKQHQDGRGAIIDPYRKVEYQYATPCFALAGAALVEHAGREDLLNATVRAMDWAVQSLARREAATAHEDFYAPVLAHALPLLERHVEAEKSRKWREQLASFDPWQIYRSGPGGGNWNVVAASGEARFHELGIREDTSFIEVSLAAQGRFFRSPWGLYLEGPMPYDHFPRLWAADMLAAGYEGVFTEPLAEVIGRAAITSLFLQSPTGELPTGGRSAHHQWNEAEQAVTFEIYGARAAAEGDLELAGVYKRAARLALSSMGRWQRPSGELWIVKNRIDPAEEHAYEGYSSHSQYNLLAMAMLVIAHGHGLATEDVEEQWTPAEVGGFLIDLRPGLPHLIANAGGSYVQINTRPDQKYNPAGLIRIHQAGFNPQLGPSDGLVRKASYRQPDGDRTTASVGVAWRDDEGNWRRLAEQTPATIHDVVIRDLVAELENVSFVLEWRGDFGGVERVIEEYTLTPDGVNLAVVLPGYDGPLRWVWPVLADDGEREPALAVEGSVVTVSLDGEQREFSAPEADRVWLGQERFPDHNGWARLAYAEFSAGGRIVLKTRFRRE